MLSRVWLWLSESAGHVTSYNHTCHASDPKQDTPIAPPTIAAFIREPSSSAKTE